MTAGGPLVCPTCDATHALDLRFCPDCGMPLVYAGSQAGDAPVSPAHARARKVKKQLLDGELTVVAWARNQAEAELIQGLLLEEGVPSLVRRTAGFDVPDMLAAGPREVLVPAGGVAVARSVLDEVEQRAPVRIPPEPADGRTRVVAGVLLAAVVIPLLAGFGLIFVR